MEGIIKSKNENNEHENIKKSKYIRSSTTTVNRKMMCLPLKKDKKVDLGNYSLISLSSVLGKNMEEILKKAIYRHIKTRT